MGKKIFEAPCAVRSSDFLDIQDETDRDGRLVSFAATNNEGHVNSVFLGEEDVRKLFNKLGIWLHQH